MVVRRIPGSTRSKSQVRKLKSEKKNRFFSKMKVRSPSWAKNISTVDPHRACASFVYTSQRIHPWRSMAKCKKPKNRSLLADLGHFLTSDVILKENFCRLASIWLIGLMKLFALGRTDLAAARKFRLVGKVANFTEKVVILLRILSSVGDGVTPLRATPGAYVQCCSEIVGHMTCSQQSILFCFFFAVNVDGVVIAIFRPIRD